MTMPALNPFFPKANASGLSSESYQALHEGPARVELIFDKENAYKPLLEFDDTAHQSNFGDNPTAAAEAFAPPQPETFKDPYLYPLLARNERLRLTLLWYYSRQITKDETLMSKLDGLVTIVQEFMGWDFAAVGMVDEAVYTTLAAANLPLALLPRREIACSHTINQAPGTVFSITNMADDWRFRSAPQVALGGLRSYAGTQLRIRADTGEEVALGSLCIGSNTVQKPLTQDQKDSLVRFAEIITSELVSTLRQNRIREKERMLERLMKLKEEKDVSEQEFKARLDDLIKSFYPAASISIQNSDEDLLCLAGDLKIHLNAVRAGLWEDTTLINEMIKAGNHPRLQSSQPVRAIVSKCGSFNVFVVVASSDIQHVFDDYDAWFIEKCAQVMADFIQQQYLQEALHAKEAFLRGITHQLRTPIHGVLASSELLAEELASPDFSIRGQEPYIRDSALTHLQTIRSSGGQLMATVNDLLKFNNWSRNKAEDLKPRQYDLHYIENDIMDRLRESMPEPYNPAVLISFEVQLARERSLVTIDPGILQDALQPLIVNALQATARGSITVKVSTQAGNSMLQFDIVDTGSGIPSCDQTRVFQPFEKGSIHANGAGLGLTLAVKAAHLLGGTLYLVTSEQGKGSHFRVELRGLTFTDSISQETAKSPTRSTTISTTSDPSQSLSSLSTSPPITQKAPLAPRALLVDDNAINLKVLRMYCEKRAIPYLLATNGQEAIAQFKMASETGPVNLVLMDLQMPVCGGLEACTSIRAFEAANAMTPCTLFMVTGQDSPSDRSLSVEAGSNEFLVKPVSLKLLDKHLARYRINVK